MQIYFVRVYQIHTELEHFSFIQYILLTIYLNLQFKIAVSNWYFFRRDSSPDSEEFFFCIFVFEKIIPIIISVYDCSW